MNPTSTSTPTQRRQEINWAATGPRRHRTYTLIPDETAIFENRTHLCLTGALLGWPDLGSITRNGDMSPFTAGGARFGVRAGFRLRITIALPFGAPVGATSRVPFPLSSIASFIWSIAVGRVPLLQPTHPSPVQTSPPPQEWPHQEDQDQHQAHATHGEGGTGKLNIHSSVGWKPFP